MKILNIVLSILILLLAIASAAFSYMLFEKREQMLGGYEKLSKGIQQASSALDVNSGTNVAKSLDGKALSHKSTDLSSAINKLSAQARKIAEQRNSLAQALADIDAKVKGGTEGVEFNRLTEVVSSPEAIEEITTQVDSFVTNRDQIVKMLISVGNDFDIALNEGKLKSSNRADYEKVLRAFASELNDVKKYKDMQEATMKEVASGLGTPGLSFSPVRYKDDLAKYTAAINGLKKEKSNLDAARQELTKKLSAADAEVAKLNTEIAELKATAARLTIDYDRLQTSIQGQVYQYPVALWQPGSIEARKAVEGKIIDVNAKFGYVVINIGAETMVNQNLGDNIAPAQVNPEITTDTTMVVARNTKSVARIKIFKVEGNCAFASIVEGNESNIKLGDTVFFDMESK